MVVPRYRGIASNDPDEEDPMESYGAARFAFAFFFFLLQLSACYFSLLGNINDGIRPRIWVSRVELSKTRQMFNFYDDKGGGINRKINRIE